MARSSRRLALGAVLYRLRREAAEAFLRFFPERHRQWLGPAAPRAAAGAPSPREVPRTPTKKKTPPPPPRPPQAGREPPPAVPAVPPPRRAPAAHAGTGLRARHRDLADLYRRSQGLPRRAHGARRGLRIRGRGGDAVEHENPDEGLRPVRARRSGRPAAGDFRRQSHAALLREPQGCRAAAGHSAATLDNSAYGG